MAVLRDPADTDELTLKDVVDWSMSVSGPASAFRVLLDRNTVRSEGIESSPQQGTIAQRFLVAR